MRTFLDWLALRSPEPGMARAQFGELQRQVPLLYALLSVNSVAVSYTHYGAAPDWMTVWAPGALVGVSLARLAQWLRGSGARLTEADILHRLQLTIALGSGITLAYILWALTLAGYGNDHQQAHVAIFIAITVIGCICCLAHLPQAALAVTACATVPYLLFYVTPRDAVYTAIGLNILLVTLVMIRSLLNSFGGFSTLIRTQVEAERLNREVTKLAHTDMLTGLPNRRLFFTEAEDALGRCRAAGRRLAFGVIDLDRFKAANDTFGHVLGDALLAAVGGRLAGIFDGQGLVARLGGDEFAFILEGSGADDAVALANRACGTLSEPFQIGEIAVSIGASCGVATTREIAGDARALYDGADYALYQAKSGARGYATLYSPAHERRIRSEHAVEAALQTARLDAEMEVHFQPIARVAGGAVTAVEALARWTSPQLGRVGPDVFIPLAERAGIMHRLTLTLLAKALDGLGQLPEDVRLAFNLSAHDITCHETMMAVVSLVRRSGIRPSRLVVELTETAVLRDFETAEASMRLLRSLGVSIALDDFGTGQSSLSYLRRLPIDEVKVDRSFMADESDTQGRELLSAVVALCRSMRMTCIAEGVEDAEQLRFLAAIGCDSYQGYLLAKPMPVAEMVAWNDARRGAETPRTKKAASPIGKAAP